MYANFLIVYFLIAGLLMSVAVASPNIVYHKNSTPLFTFIGLPLIESVRGSYSIQNVTYQGPLMNFNDSNISIQYLMYGRRVAKNSPTLTWTGEVYERDPKTGEIRLINAPDQSKQISQETPYETKLTGIEGFLTPDMSEQITYSVTYKVKNSNIGYFTPFIFDLGTWPKFINDTDIDRILDSTINQDVIIYGDNHILIVRKDSKEFNYKINKNNENYLLSIGREIERPVVGTLNVYLRPVVSNFRVEIEEVNWGSFNEPLSFRPKLVLNVSDKNITTFKFTYQSANGYIPIDLDLNRYGEIEFVKTIYPKGKEILYPFDSYTSQINVYPPLLNRDVIAIGMPYGSQFIGELKTDNNKFTITLKRDPISIITYFGLLLIPLIPLLIGIYYNQTSIFTITSVIIAVVLFFVNKNLRYVNSIGSILSIIILLVLIWIFFNRDALFGT